MLEFGWQIVRRSQCPGVMCGSLPALAAAAAPPPKKKCVSFALYVLIYSSAEDVRPRTPPFCSSNIQIIPGTGDSDEKMHCFDAVFSVVLHLLCER